MTVSTMIFVGEESAAAPKEMTGRKGESSYFFVSIFPLKLELTRIFARIFRLFADSLISFERATRNTKRNER